MELSTTESQAHGKTIEDEIKFKVYGVEKNYSQTNIHDIESFDNIITGKNVSIKTTGSDKKIDCGDIVRFLGLSNTEIVVAFYIQNDKYKEVIKTYLLDHDKFINKLKLDIPIYCSMSFDKWIQEVKLYVSVVRCIKPGRVVDKSYKTQKTKLCLPYFNIAPKVDSKNQRRVQCSIKDFTEFIIENNKGSILYNKQYNGKVMCGRRIRHKK